jgi:cytosine/adenosine deaminase-related metal-dependent hydrolase
MASHSSRRSSKGDTRWANGTMIPLPGKTSWRETNPSEEYRPWSFSIQSHLQSIRNAIAAGVPLLCGTDLPPADDLGGLPATVLEMKLLEEAGLSRLAAHETATVNPAKLMGAADRSSSVQPSFFADLIAVTTTPWTTWPPSALSVSCYRRAGP